MLCDNLKWQVIRHRLIFWFKIHSNFIRKLIPYISPKNNIFICPNCKMNINLAPLRLQIESQTGKKIVI